MAPKTVTALEPDPETVTVVEKFLGGLALGSFVFIWLSSIASPFLLVWAIINQQYIFAGIIILSTIAAYIPWEKGIFANIVRENVKYYSPRYYKSISMKFEENLPDDSQQQTLYSIHPHGAFCIGWAMLFCHDVMQHVRFCFAPVLYASPFFRLFSRCSGNPGSAAKFEMIRYMKNGEHLALPPGGFEEATLTSPEHDRVFIKKRTGFIRLCLQHGIAVRPVYVFGEKSLYWNIQGGWKFRLALNRFGLPTIITWGNTLLPLLPKKNVDIYIVVGSPIILPKIEKPTKEDVSKWHNKYVAALTKLFEEHKEDAYGTEYAKAAKLEIW